MSLMIYRLLTTTAKSPPRPGDLESRRYLVQSMRVEGGLVVLGPIVLVGLAVQLATHLSP